VLDEAMNAVDSLSENEILRLINRHEQFRSLLIISHRRSTINACQRGIVVKAGRVIEQGPLRDLDYYRAMESELL
jgi:subfamily B ATP-binding cassette protein MsbA